MPEVFHLAVHAGVDTEELRAFLAEYVPQVNFLTCYTEGAAFVRQADIISSAPALQAHHASLDMYRLIALADTLLAPLLQPRDVVNRLGVGMYEHFAQNPKVRDILKNSAEFHYDLTKDYFPVPEYSPFFLQIFK